MFRTFPIRSQRFILRLASALVRHSDSELHLLVTGGFDRIEWREAIQNYPELSSATLHFLNSHTTRIGQIVQGLSTISQSASADTWLSATRFWKSPNSISAIDRLRALRLALLLRSAPQLDTLHFQFLVQAREALFAHRLGCLDAPVVAFSARGADTTGKDSHKNVSAFLELAALRADVYALPVASNLRRSLIETGVEPSKVRTCRSPFDVASHDYVTPSLRPSRPFHLVFIGRFVEKKGPLLALRAVHSLVEMGHAVRLTMVGDGPLKQAIKRAIMGLDLGCFVTLQGWSTEREIDNLLRSANAILIPSERASSGDSEGVPNVAKEAAAAGVIIISSDHGGLPDLVEDGLTGYCFAQGNAEACAATILKCTVQREEHDAIARAARERTAHLFSPESVVRDLLRLYHLEPSQT